MNRRNFLSISSLLALVPLVGAKKAIAAPKASSAITGRVPTARAALPPWPPHARPQTTPDDLVAEYKAWVAGDLDDHDKAVVAYRARVGQAVPGLHPSMAYGRCSCTKEVQVQVQVQLDREIAQQRRILEENHYRMKGLLQRSARREQQGAPASRYKGTLPQWMTE